MFNIQFKKYPVSCFLIAVIWYLSLFFNAPKTPFDSMQLIDKWVHFVMYGGTFGVLWIEYLRQHSHANFTKLFVWAWVAPILMSGLLELLQAYATTTRSGEWLDFAANSLGVTLGAVFGMLLAAFRARR
jgi:VanZ family protein